MALIYKITNLINNKIYIGKTKRDLNTRWLEHCRDAKNYQENNNPLHAAIKKYGKENFIYEILEDNISEQELNEREKYYIKYYNSKSHDLGYNVTDGGDGGQTSSILTAEVVNEIILILQDKNNLLSFNEIGDKYNISGSVIRSINIGTSWHKKSISYPIRTYSTTGLTINRDVYAKIINDILNTEETLQKIQYKYNLSEQQMTAINQGYGCYTNDNKYYKGIYLGQYPIRKNNNKKIDNIDFIKIFYEVLFTDKSITQIGIENNIQGNTLTYIINGKRRKELTQNFLVPMRKNIINNQEIFNKMYPDYKRGGDDD